MDTVLTAWNSGAPRGSIQSEAHQVWCWIKFMLDSGQHTTQVIYMNSVGTPHSASPV